MPTPLIAESYGATALLIRCEPDQTLAVAERARERWPAALDVVPAADSVVVDGVEDPRVAAEEVRAWSVAARIPAGGRSIELETRYDGPDLAEVAALWRISPDDVVDLHTGTTFVVAFCGFSPGFAYCTGLSPERAVPRRSSPRPRVNPGSVALADVYTGVYPSASPGGWQVIGRTDAALWDLARDEPALLSPGTTVRFVAR